MQLRQLGQSEIRISPIVMGTWQAGKQMWADIDDDESIRAIQAAYEAGITTFDTAEVYGEGHSERILGQALAAVRDRAVIATKVFATHLAYDQVMAACERSLKNLGTDRIDLYQIHWPAGAFGSPRVPLEESLRALTELKRQGKIRAIGVSNFSRDQLAEALQHARIDSLQPPYSLLWRHLEQDAMTLCRERNITVLAYSPMAQGILTGKFGADHRFAKGDHRSRNRLFRPPHWPRVQQALAQLRAIAQRHGCTLGQLALAWVLHQPPACPIAGARRAEQAAENAAAASVVLSPADLAEMDRISRSVTDHLDANPVLWQW
jgi:aryl-alcohol dehydrogenase-like predicted oxidoreductase